MSAEPDEAGVAVERPAAPRAGHEVLDRRIDRTGAVEVVLAGGWQLELDLDGLAPCRRFCPEAPLEGGNGLSNSGPRLVETDEAQAVTVGAWSAFAVASEVQAVLLLERLWPAGLTEAEQVVEALDHWV